jgi:hypothetical protein
MKPNYFFLFILSSAFLFISWKIFEKNWIAEKQKGYTLMYTSIDKSNKKEYRKFIDNGINSVKTFFHSSYKNAFNVFIHPYRQSLDSAWQKDWNMPTFKSACWMVASGVATKLDMISPKLWDKQSCEHIYSETTKTQQLITHELVHIYHGQLNISPDFSNVEGIDWFVEGLATFASGQCDSSRIAEVKKAIFENKIPTNLDNFWTGKIKYGLSGSVVKYIDQKYGREKLKELLPLNKKSDILATLKITETELLNGWKKYIQDL